MGTALDGIEFCLVMNVLGTEIIAGAELALLLCRQAVHPPPNDGPRGRRTRRVIKMSSAQARLTAAPVLREAHRLDVNPAIACRGQFDPDRQPVCFRHITQIAENRETSGQRADPLRPQRDQDCGALWSAGRHVRLNAQTGNSRAAVRSGRRRDRRYPASWARERSAARYCLQQRAGEGPVSRRGATGRTSRPAWPPGHQAGCAPERRAGHWPG